MVQVYNPDNKSFRAIKDSANEAAYVLLDRSAVSILKQHYTICGFFFLDTINRIIHPIDISERILAIPEKTIPKMSNTCISSLEKYNLTEGIDYNPSLAFLSISSVENYNFPDDYFANLCYGIFKNQVLLNSLAYYNDSLIFPISTQELYEFAQYLFRLFHFDYLTQDYKLGFKYTIDGLINGYHINFTKSDIEYYAYNISRLAFERLVENHE